jgi:hypothetical protein
MEQLAILDGITGDFVLPERAYRATILSLQGTPAAPFTLTVPNCLAQFTVNNQTPVRATVKTAGGTGAEVLSGRNSLMFVDTAGNVNTVF